MSALERLARRKKLLLRVLLGVFAVYWALTVYLAVEGGLARPTAWGDVTMLALMAVIVGLFTAIMITRRAERRIREHDKTGG